MAMQEHLGSPQVRAMAEKKREDGQQQSTPRSEGWGGQKGGNKDGV